MKKSFHKIRIRRYSNSLVDSITSFSILKAMPFDYAHLKR